MYSPYIFFFHIMSRLISLCVVRRLSIRYIPPIWFCVNPKNIALFHNILFLVLCQWFCIPLQFIWKYLRHICWVNINKNVDYIYKKFFFYRNTKLFAMNVFLEDLTGNNSMAIFLGCLCYLLWQHQLKNIMQHQLWALCKF